MGRDDLREINLWNCLKYLQGFQSRDDKGRSERNSFRRHRDHARTMEPRSALKRIGIARGVGAIAKGEACCGGTLAMVTAILELRRFTMWRKAGTVGKGDRHQDEHHKQHEQSSDLMEERVSHRYLVIGKPCLYFSQLAPIVPIQILAVNPWSDTLGPSRKRGTG